jgi:hypothetical protein
MNETCQDHKEKGGSVGNKAHLPGHGSARRQMLDLANGAPISRAEFIDDLEVFGSQVELELDPDLESSELF